MSRISPVDKWFHIAAVWDRHANEAQLFKDGKKVKTQALSSGSYPRQTSRLYYDVGLKKDNGKVLRGFMRDLMIVGRAVTEEELTNMTSKLKSFAFEVVLFPFF